MELSEKMCWFWISNIPEIGLKSISTLLNAIDNIKDIYEASDATLEKIEGIPSNLVKIIIQSRKTEKIIEEYNKLTEKNIYFVTKEETSYPEKLRNIYEAPYFLYYKGKLPIGQYPSVSIIGARNCTSYGRQTALSIAKELAEHQIQVISGMARGIDSYAHYGALKGGGTTFAVLGCGIDICYPSENHKLYERIIEQGGIISEYPMGAQPLPFHFPMRNRIISGLSDAILVVEARESSGTFITVDRGLEQGKDIFAIPGRIGDALSSGCNGLIQRGAKLILNVDDIIEELHLNRTFLEWNEGKNNPKNTSDIKKCNIALERDEKIVYDRLSLEPKHLENLLQETGLPKQQLLSALLSLELKNIVTQWVSNYYILNS